MHGDDVPNETGRASFHFRLGLPATANVGSGTPSQQRQGALVPDVSLSYSWMTDSGRLPTKKPSTLARSLPSL